MKNIQASIQEKPNITREEVEHLLWLSGLVTIASSLKENIEKGIISLSKHANDDKY